MNSAVLRCARYSKLKNKIQERYPGTKIRYKEDHWFWKHLPDIFKNSSNAFYKTIWMSERNCDFETLGHEYAHIVDMHNIGLFQYLLFYGRPQTLAIIPIFLLVLSLMLGFFWMPIVLGVASILLLCPWPSPSRVNLEQVGYTMTLYINKLTKDTDPSVYEDFVIDSLKSWLYYKMIWTARKAREVTNEILSNIADNKIPETNVAFKDIYEIIIDIDATK